ncbi:MAG TPA: hypothetical protein PKJ77_04055, partial [Thermodesulfobacteriota bacterium]|nr:hypothetical protein [Thermodesulfobacteriota bacterium]
MSSKNNYHQNDERLRDLFTRMRSADEAQTPSFNSMWARAERLLQSRQHSAPRRTIRTAFAAAGAFAVIAGLVMISVPIQQNGFRPDSNESLLEAKNLLQWESPTAALLSSSEEEFSSDTASGTSSTSEIDLTESDWEMPTDSLLTS